MEVFSGHMTLKCFLSCVCSDIMISPVKPVPSMESHMLQAGVPDTVQNFYMCNDVDVFQLDRPFHTGERDDKNEFKVGGLRPT